MEKENRTELEEAEYLYLDKLISYIDLYTTARQMGNKNPDNNFLVSGAKKKMEEAQKRMQEVKMRCARYHFILTTRNVSERSL